MVLNGVLPSLEMARETTPAAAPPRQRLLLLEIALAGMVS